MIGARKKNNRSKQNPSIAIPNASGFEVDNDPAYAAPPKLKTNIK